MTDDPHASLPSGNAPAEPASEASGDAPAAGPAAGPSAAAPEAAAPEAAAPPAMDRVQTWDPGAIPEPYPAAMDRVQTPDREAEPPSRLSWSWLAGIAILVLTIVGVWTWVNRDVPQESSLLLAAAEGASEFRTSVPTNDPDRAASYVLEEFGLSLFPPEIEGYALLGVGPAELAPGVVVPGYRYGGPQNAALVVYAYDYILLDAAEAENLLRLAPEVYARLAEPEPVDSRRVGEAYVVTWRRRATIYSAVTPGQESAEQILQSVRLSE